MHVLVDTFVGTGCRGNPALVCEFAEFPPAGIMQDIAINAKVPVTAFIVRRPAATVFYIRYFTSTGEIPACGHATLAAAWLVMEGAPISFRTVQGLSITATRADDIITLRYPVYTLRPYRVESAMLRALGIREYTEAGFCNELETLFMEMNSEAELKVVKPDYDMLIKSSDTIKEVVITAAGDSTRYDYMLRSFCPWIGISEDPVTGSVHSVLAGYWKRRIGKSAMTAYQASDRGGEIFVDNLPGHITIGGRCSY